MKYHKVPFLFNAMALVFFPFVSHAANIQGSCPTIEAIAKTNFDSAHISGMYPGKWAIMQTNQKYDMNTELKWDFAIILDAKSQEDAYLIAKNSFGLMTMPNVPIHIGGKFLLCEYKMPIGFRAMAIYPAGYSYP